MLAQRSIWILLANGESLSQVVAPALCCLFFAGVILLPMLWSLRMRLVNNVTLNYRQFFIQIDVKVKNEQVSHMSETENEHSGNHASACEIACLRCVLDSRALASTISATVAQLFFVVVIVL